MTHSELFAKIDSLYAQYVQIWADVCNIESPTANKAGVDAVGEYFIAMARERGWAVEVLEQKNAGNAICITMNPDVPGAPVSLSGHMDTVHPVGLFGSPAVRIEDNIIYGPGVCDCKGGIVMGMLAMDALDQCGFRTRPVQMLLQSDEEVGSALSNDETINWICEKAKNSVAFLNLEGYTEGEICLVRKGCITFTFTVTGEEAHSSLCAKKGANAILEAAYKIIELEKIKDHDGLTCCCSVISGGTVSNTVPGQCTFKANVRFANTEQLEWIRNHMKEVAAHSYVPGCTATVNDPSYRCAMEYTERNEALFNRINDIFSECGLSRLNICKRTGGSDAAEVTVSGTPCVDSIGAHGFKIHSPEEYALLSETLGEGTKRLAAIVLNL